MKRIAMIAGCLMAARPCSPGLYVEMVTHNLTTNSTELSQKMYVQDGSGRFVDKDGRSVADQG